jgi:hypothetical protein
MKESLLGGTLSVSPRSELEEPAQVRDLLGAKKLDLRYGASNLVVVTVTMSRLPDRDQVACRRLFASSPSTITGRSLGAMARKVRHDGPGGACAFDPTGHCGFRGALSEAPARPDNERVAGRGIDDRSGRIPVVCASAALTPAFRRNPSVSVVNRPDARNRGAAAWRARRTTPTRPRHTAPRVLPYVCPAALTRSARGTPVVSDVILRVPSQTTGRGDLCGAAFIGLGDHPVATALASDARASR